jgi:hypothetical protein
MKFNMFFYIFLDLALPNINDECDYRVDQSTGFNFLGESCGLHGGYEVLLYPELVE